MNLRVIRSAKSSAVVVALFALPFLGNAQERTSDLKSLIQTAAEGTRFPGRVQSANDVNLASTVDSVVTDIHFRPAQLVEAGDLLFTLDATEFELKVRLAEADLLEAQANLLQAEQDLERVNRLLERGTTTATQLEEAKARYGVRRAHVLRAEAALDGAQIDLDSTLIRAPISGQVSAPSVSIGSFVEAEAGAPLAHIVQLDPVIVAYEEPYIEQIELFHQSGLESPNDFLGLFNVRLELAADLVFDGVAKPDRVSSTVGEDSGTITVWAEFPNPAGILRPGMTVTVLPELDRDAME